jgi:putative DNA-binding protein
MFMSLMRRPPIRVPEPSHAATRPSTERRHGMHRHHATGGLVAALAERFPVVQRLVGEEFFRGMARAFVTQEPPRSPVLLQLGATFPAFIDGFDPTVAIPYLGDVARLELARSRAAHAADAASLSDDDLATCPAAELADMRVVLHPSISVVASRHPIVSIWEAHHDADATVPVQSWSAETALVARPFHAVDLWRLPPGGGAFLTALARGMTVAQATKTARDADRTFDLDANLAVLFGARVMTGFGENPVTADV